MENNESQEKFEEKQQRQHALLKSLFRELFQSERSAMKHPRREAERLGGGPPAQALLAVSDHAASGFADLHAAARAHEVPVSRPAMAIGSLLSIARHVVLDRAVDAERSYRATLLGMRHGVDVMKLIRKLADASGRVELAGFATRWLEQREPLVERVESAMGWFAEHPQRAAEMPRARRRRRRHQRRHPAPA
ncbi:MAG TPA: hypothetical protein VFU21_13160 [Kofleriaceae bacterium]|nr:hypothetical protein [Kofleriaceae bacterium]